MKAVILAGGLGSRLGDLTKDTPKPLLEVAGKPILEHIVSRLEEAGIKEIIVNIHYLPEMIREYLKNRVLYFYTPTLLGHEGTIKALENWLTEDFFVINGDTISNADFKLMIETHKKQKGTILALLDEWRCAGTWLYCAEYFTNPKMPVNPFRQENLKWQDCGTPEKLTQAQEMFNG